ncbi:hypothetical protein [Methylobacterium sp. 1030]|uniref:hypothetical protein n=1 Tax=Methylobacterium sp. 1030 TaxID=3156404 RepID=UPI00339328C8
MHMRLIGLNALALAATDDRASRSDHGAGAAIEGQQVLIWAREVQHAAVDSDLGDLGDTSRMYLLC